MYYCLPETLIIIKKIIHKNNRWPYFMFFFPVSNKAIPFCWRQNPLSVLRYSTPFYLLPGPCNYQLSSLPNFSLPKVFFPSLQYAESCINSFNDFDVPEVLGTVNIAVNEQILLSFTNFIRLIFYVFISYIFVNSLFCIFYLTTLVKLFLRAFYPLKCWIG